MTSVPFEHGGTQLDLTFTWGVFETLQAEWGDDYQGNLNSLFVHGDVTYLRFVASLVSGRTLGVDTVLPVQKLINAMYRAYELGWSGRVVDPSPEDGGDETRKKFLRFGKFWRAT